MSKRIFDIVSSSVGLILLSPLFFVVAMIIKLTSKGTVFYRQIRVGKNGKEFKIFKFRTMVQDADKKGAQLTCGADSRITSIGRLLRFSKLD